jgi:hypothetical protein
MSALSSTRRDVGDSSKQQKKRKVSEYVKLPDNWVIVNSVVLYEKKDIEIVRKYIDENVIVNGKKSNWTEAHGFSFAPEVVCAMPPDMLGVFARNSIPAQQNPARHAERLAFATEYKRARKREPLKFKD